ncbi:DUF3048 domain-containing protein [Clostridium thermarum]|uniref:DUF3048 domain-containing protein n=1 Tax=Clostridium thermarum TaxID=1716543 RepID=UPI0013D8646F|nr:DUF3048 domain-containing protein [Clostridium thermarum]
MNNKTRRGRNMGIRLLTTVSLLIVGSIVGYLALGDREESETAAPVISQKEAQPTPTPSTAPPHEKEMEKLPKYLSPYTGEEISKETRENIPFMVIIENSRASRPQSGLSEADIIYETMAEGGIPRFIAVFHSSSPKEIGPVRSARPYFLTLAKEYNLPFGHCGGSAEALDIIKDEKLMSMNEFSYGGYYWRDDSRKAPHNLYTSADKLRRLITNKSMIQVPASSLIFNMDSWNKSLASAENVDLKLSPYYSTSYSYKDGLYYKYMDGIIATDKSNGKELTASNIVIQTTDIKILDDYGRLDIKLAGAGTGYVISGGKCINVIWSKADDKSPTVLKDEKGNAIALTPGKTWWHIADNNLKLEIK